MDIKWSRLGSGSYNNTYISDCGKLVLKIIKTKDPDNDENQVLKIIKSNPDETHKIDESDDDDSNAPDRCVRVWNELNPNLLPNAYTATTNLGDVWICPFVAGDEASDSEIAKELINIYNRTGRIIVDASSTKNFIKTPSNQIICVDIGMALQLELEEQRLLGNAMIRRPSETSLTSWKLLQKNYTPYFQRKYSTYRKTTEIIKALLFIKTHRPDIHTLTFLENKPTLISLLFQAYDDNTISQTALAMLENEVPVNFDHIKKSCIHELRKYIASRGTINQNNQFDPSFITQLFRNNALTKNKVLSTMELIKKIEQSETIQDIEDNLMSAAQENNKYNTRYSKSGLAASINRCFLKLPIHQLIPERNLSCCFEIG